MRIRLKPPQGAEIPASLPYAGAEHVLLHSPRGRALHPACSNGGPLMIRGSTEPTHDHDTYRCQAVCAICLEPIGVLLATVSTLFGIDEDERVLHGRPRVY